MHLLAAVFLLSAPLDAQTKPKTPTKAEQKAAEDAKKAEEEAAAKKAEEEAAAKAAADAEAAKKAAEEEAAKKAVAEAQAAEQAALEARGLDARMRALTDLVGLALKRLPGDHRSQRFAVMPFDEVGDAVQKQKLGVVVGDIVVTNLARDHRLSLVERAALAKILDEQALGQTGALADGQAAQVGKVAGARALVVGQVTDGGDSFRVSVRAVDVETGSVIDGSTREVKLPKDELVAFSANAVVLRSKSGAMFRSVVLPGWGQSYNDEPTKALVFGVATGGLALATITTAAIAGYTRFVLYPEIGTRPEDAKAKADGTIGETVKATREAGEAGLVVAGVLAGATAITWGVNVLDAYLSGTDVESLDAALAKN
jgi:TolB-like protein